MSPAETEKFARLHRFTVIAFCLTILTIMAVFAYIVFLLLPDITYKITKQALNEVYDERIELTQ